MTLHLSYSLRPNGVALGVQWLVLLAFLFATIISSIGGTSSHGLAAIATALHVTPFSSDESHEHVHEDEDIGVMNQSASADHSHHGPDHSHDKAQTLPAAWTTEGPQLPAWFGLVRPWSEMIQASRLERPPKG